MKKTKLSPRQWESRRRQKAIDLLQKDGSIVHVYANQEERISAIRNFERLRYHDLIHNEVENIYKDIMGCHIEDREQLEETIQEITSNVEEAILLCRFSFCDATYFEECSGGKWYGWEAVGAYILQSEVRNELQRRGIDLDNPVPQQFYCGPCSHTYRLEENDDIQCPKCGWAEDEEEEEEESESTEEEK